MVLKGFPLAQHIYTSRILDLLEEVECPSRVCLHRLLCLSKLDFDIFGECTVPRKTEEGEFCDRHRQR